MNIDHYLVAAKIRMRLSITNKVRPTTQRKLDVRKLQSQQTAVAYNVRLSALLNRPKSIAEDPVGCWTHISRSIKLAAEDTISYTCPKARKKCYDQQYRDDTTAKGVEYRKIFRSAATRATWENYRE